MNKELAITVNALKKTYSDGFLFSKKLQALKAVTFDVNQGEIFGLLGPNGAGKTTLVKILLGIIRKSGGSATMLGKAAGSRAGRAMVGYLPEHLRIPPYLTGNTALECYGNLSNVPTSVIRSKQEELLSLVGLADRARDRVKKYSKGMLQRLGLAQSLLHEPKLLILDEPTDGLDPRARADMRSIIKRLQQQGVTIFLNSHILHEVEMICDRVAILDRGDLRYCGTVDAVGDFVKSLVGDSVAGTILQIEVAGKPSEVTAAFDETKFEIKSSDGQSRFVIRAYMDGQEGIDALVDRLRARDVSLIRLEREHVSLEDAFLKIVEDANENRDKAGDWRPEAGGRRPEVGGRR